MRQAPRRTVAGGRAPLLTGLVAAVLIGGLAPRATSAQTAPRPSASQLTLSSEGDAGEVVLTGRGVELFRSVRLRPLSGRSAPRGIDPALGRADRGQRPLGFRVARGATQGRFAVYLVQSDGRSVRLDFTLEVVAAQPRLLRLEVAPREVDGGTAAALHVVLDRPAGSDGVTVVLAAGGAARVPSRIGVRPGDTEAKIEITTAVVTSRADVRVVATLGDDRLAANLVVLPAFTYAPRTLTTTTLTMSGARFTPVALETTGLRATGRRFAPVVLETHGLGARGLRFRPLVLQTTGLRATGVRFTPRNLTTITLRMTGRSDPS